MTFNHYAKIKQVLEQEPAGWYIKRIDQPTAAKNFRGETVKYDHYYRVYSHNKEQTKYCKFQKIDKLASVLNTTVEDLPVIE